MTSIKVPPLGESIVEATVSKWLKSEGDAVAPGDTLVELETDKITVEVPSVTGGVLKKRFVSEGDVVKLDQPLAEVDESAQASAAKKDGQKPAESATAPSKPASPAPAPARAEAPRASPAAQRAAAETGADLSRVQGTGRGGVISKADVVEAKGAAPAAPVAPRPDAARPMADVRRPPSGRLPRSPRKNVHAPETDRGTSARVAARDGPPHDVQRDRHERRRGGARPR